MRLWHVFSILLLVALLSSPIQASSAPLHAASPAPAVHVSNVSEHLSPAELDAAGFRTLESEVRFNAVGIRWAGPLFPGGDPGLEVRLSGNAEQWTEWIPVADASDDAPREGQPAFGLVFVDSARYLQYRLAPSLSRAAIGGPGDLDFQFIDSSEGPTVEQARAEARQADSTSLTASAVDAPLVIPRSGWGANEGYRFNASGQVIWPVEYRTIEKAIIHHTVTKNGDPDPAATVRAIYYYHAITQGWGDIGYNFLIDWQGNIYEGRYGGPNVVGGHALRYNPGSVGVAVLGDFTAADIPFAAEDALVRVVAWKTQHLDPHGSSYFVDTVLPNIIGHRDALPTECPGNNLATRLPEIRDRVGALVGGTPTPALAVRSVSFTPSTLNVGNTLRVDITVANVGTGTASTQGPAPGTTYEDWETYQGKGYSDIAGKFRVAVDFSGRTGIDHPYRWGLGDALEPGQTRTITGYIHMNTAGTRSYWAGVVQESVQWWADNAGAASVIVGNSQTKADSYNTPGAGKRIYLPLLFRGYSGWNSIITVQNVGAAATGYSITFFTEAGVTAGVLSGSLPAHGSTNIALSNANWLPDSIMGAAVISAESDVTAVVRSDASPSDTLAYEGLGGGAVQGNVPLLFKNFNGWSAGLQLLNLSSSINHVRVTFYHRDGVGGPWTQDVVLVPNSPKSFDLRQMAALPGGFVGSAVVVSQDSLPVTGIVNLVKAGWKAASSYTIPAAGATNLSAPVLFKNYFGWLTGLQVQNIGNTVTSASVTYTPSNSGGGPWVETGQITPGSSRTFYQPDNSMLPDGFVGAGTVNLFGGPQGVGIVNELSYRDDVLLTYDAVASGATALYAPLVMRAADGWSSGIQVQNVGNASATIVMDYYAPDGTRVYSQQDSIAPGYSRTYYHLDVAQLPPGFVGSLVVTSQNGQPVAAIVNFKR